MQQNKITKNIIQKITILILSILIVLVITFIILKYTGTSQSLYNEFYNTMIKKTWNFIIIVIILWAAEFVLNEINLGNKGNKHKKYIKGFIFLVLMIMPTCFLINMFNDTLADYIKGFKDLKYVIEDKPLSKTEICIFTAVFTEKEKNYFNFLEKYNQKPIFETETLSLNVIGEKYYSTSCNKELGNVVKVRYLPNTNIMLDCVSTNNSVGALNATKIKESKSSKLTSKGNMFDQYSAIGAIYCDNNEYDKAISYYSKGIALIDKDTACPWGIYSGRATCYEGLSQYKNAINDYMKAIDLALANRLGDAYADGFRLIIAEDYENMGDYDSAIKEYKSITTSKQRSQDGIEEAEEKKKDYEKVKNMTNTYEPKDYKYYLNIGQEWYNEKFYEIGIKDLSTAIESFAPNGYEPFYYRGLCYHKLCNYEKAIEDFNKALDYIPNDNKGDIFDIYENNDNRKKVLEALGDSYMGMKEYEKALDAYKKTNSEYVKTKMDKAQKFVNENTNFNNYKKKQMKIN